MTPEVVGVVGLGNMGHELASNLVGQGFEVLTHDIAGPDRNPGGATFVADLDAVAGGTDCLVLSLPDGAASTAVALAIVEARHRRVAHVVDTSTIGPKMSRSVAALLSEVGVGYVDAPVSGGAAGARARTLAVMVAGAPEDRAAVESVLAGLSDRRFPVGDEPGMAQAVKLANNFLSATALAATSEALAFVASAGVDVATALDVINGSSGMSAASKDKFVDHVLTGAYASGFLNTLMAKDVWLYLDAVADLEAPTALAEVTNQVWERFAADEPAADFTRIHPYIAD